MGLLHREGSVLIAFGSLKAGLPRHPPKRREIPEKVFDVYVNMVHNQETLTVRTEEAVAFSLSTINLMRSM
jgi:predicted SPOUT superfamily RNA methylase MTH1